GSTKHRTRPGGTVAYDVNRTQTTLTTGVGEQIPYHSSRGKTAAIAISLVALAGIGFVAYQRGLLGGKKSAGPVAAETIPGPVNQPPVAPPTTTTPPVPTTGPPAKPPAEATITVVIESTPAGARVVGAQDGKVLGQTPLTLTRAATGGELAVRIEKDGYLPVDQSVTLKRDETLAVTLERKKAARAPRRQPSVEEPAKL